MYAGAAYHQIISHLKSHTGERSDVYVLKLDESRRTIQPLLISDVKRKSNDHEEAKNKTEAYAITAAEVCSPQESLLYLGLTISPQTISLRMCSSLRKIASFFYC